MKTKYIQRTETWMFALMLLVAGIAGVTVAVMAEPVEVDLVADGGEEYSPGVYGLVVGTVKVSNDDEFLYVEYLITLSDAANDWVINETHVDVNLEFKKIPQTKSGNPKPGRFDSKTYHDPGVKAVVHVFSLEKLGAEPGDTLYVAAQAAITNMAEPIFGPGEDGEPGTADDVFLGYREESAWGEGEDFPGSNWAMYFEYDMQGVVPG